MILFLDFDGVLHPEPCHNQENLFWFLPRLEAVLMDYPNVRVVITSTWRETRTINMLRGFFQEKIRHRVISVTPNWRDHEELLSIIGFQRHTEIEAWLRSSSEPWTPWIALDDKPYLFHPFLPNLIKTKSSTGFDDVAETKLRASLADS